LNELQGIVREESKTGKKLLFAFPRVGSSLVLGMEGFALFNLYWNGFGLSAFLVGLTQAIGFLVVGLSQFFFGWVSDAKYTKWGRRKPYIVAFAPILGISFIFLFLPSLFLPDLSDTTILFVWFFIWDLIFKISYSLTTVYQSWMAEQFIVSERPKVSQFQNYFNWIGNGSMALVSIIVLTGYVDDLIGPPRNPNTPIPMNFLLITIAFGVIAIVSFTLVGLLMPTEPKFEIKSNLKENLKIVIHNRNYLRITLMIGIASLAWSIVTDVILAYSQAALFLTGTDFYIIAGVLLIGIFSFLLVWRRLLEKLGKQQALLYIFLFSAITLPVSLLALIEAFPRLILGIIFVVLATGALGGWFLFPYIIYADIAEDDEKKTGHLKAGIYAGFNSIIGNIFQAFGVFILGTAIDALPIITLTGQNVALGLIVFGPICTVILLVAYFYTKKFVTLDFDWEKK